MINKLPSWVWIPAWVFAFVAGMVNAVGFLGFSHQAITHLTGTTSLLAIAIASGDFPLAMRLVAFVVSFLGGCALSGFIIQNSTLKLGRGYGLVLFIESAMLFTAGFLLNGNRGVGLYLATAACGLQNAMVSSFSGAVIRTTHVSGMFTDLGIFLGHALRKIPVEPLRLKLCLVVISAFLCGGIAGTLCFARVGFSALFLCAGIVGLTGFYYEFRFRSRI